MGFWEQVISGFLLLLENSEIWSITLLSLFVSLSAVILSSTIGIPVGIWLATHKYRGKITVNILINTGMSMPPVFLGLIIFLVFARSGPLGSIRILFTPLVMILAQFLLTLPIIIGVTRSRYAEIPEDLPETLLTLGCTGEQVRAYSLFEIRSGIMTAVILGLGRAISEVGAIIIVGGNIRFHTRVLTTAIITEVSKGTNEMAVAMGIIIIIISIVLNSIFTMVQAKES